MAGLPEQGAMFITFNGETRSLMEWARLTGIKKTTIWARLKRGWPVEEALNTKREKRILKTTFMRSDANLITYNGETLPLYVWSNRTGIGRLTIAWRIKHGWTVEEALTVSPQIQVDCNGLTGKHKSEFWAWKDMVRRCYDDHHRKWKHYGGRGITVCKRWRDSFLFFLEDMGAKAQPKLTLDRIDNNGNYKPSNCRWISFKENQRNRRNNRLVTFGNETKCLSAWAEIAGLLPSTLAQRLKKGWSMEIAMTAPIGSLFGPGKNHLKQ